MASITVPPIIPAGRQPRASDFYQMRQAIIELQALRTFSFTHCVEADTDYVDIDGLPSDLGFLTVQGVAQTTGDEVRARVGVSFTVNDDDSSIYDWSLIEWSPNGAYGGGLPTATYSQKQLNQQSGVIGQSLSTLGGDEDVAFHCTFPNWGYGSSPLCWTATAGCPSWQTVIGGSVPVARPYTKIRLFSGSDTKAGTIFTLHGFYL